MRTCERQLSPLSLVCTSLSTFHDGENIAIAKVSTIIFQLLTILIVNYKLYYYDNQVPLSGSDVSNESGVIPEININCSIAGELVPCSNTVPTYSNNTCESALLEV